ncbi:hypothetical protein C1645_794965 [Glomus cerebriforme]|uniref:Uncharacterized protein n=1 Tax=Glomus cerebriforme TaxID=658196 RepID=A0A397RXP0_9GLOM|nr:hypothetical protein C1645_794965 [Glomus cerebriforme]
MLKYMEYLKIQIQKIIFWFLKMNFVKYVVNELNRLLGVNNVKVIILKKILQTGQVEMKKLIISFKKCN